MRIHASKRWGWLVTVSFALILGSCNSPTMKEEKTSARGPANFPGAQGGYGYDSSKEYFSAPDTKGLKANEMLGRDIWFKATAGNDRFHMYSIGQRVGNHNMDFWRLLNGPRRYSRFQDWGLINDPDCCTPGEAGCPAKSFAETYGMDYCPGDDELLKYVGRKDAEYRDPACDMPDLDGKKVQSACDLRYGTSAGAVGFRKFPNPRFDREKWLAVQGNTIENWAGYQKQISDSSIEPPFRVGISCASCHVSFDPVRPPKDPNRPQWFNLSGTVGNQYMYMSQLFGSGFKHDTLEWQMMTNARPGTVDTSVIPNDRVHNPGTVNAIINFTKRPTFQETVDTWRRAESCSTNDPDICTCNEQGSRCYQKSKKLDTILHVLKGGEDSVGKEGAVLRVYINIGVCAEQCWLNHLTDLFQFDKQGRNYGQTPFDIAQCRRDCPNYRALEDRVEMTRDFLLAAGPSDLYRAKGYSTPDELIPYIENERGFGEGAVARGRKVYAQSCARCHSSQKDSLESRDFLAKDSRGRRVDWLGSDERIGADEVGTFECRSLHSNHMEGHIWDAYSSEEYKKSDAVRNLSGDADKGRGRYRAISLLNVWAYAPFMHNNAVGPEICGRASGGFSIRVAGASECVPFDPSIEGRLKLYEASMDVMLNPDKRGKKQTLTSAPIRIPVGPHLRNKEGKDNTYELVIPAGISVARIGSFRHKEFLADLGAVNANRAGGKYNVTPAQQQMADEVMRQLREDMKNAKNHEVILNEAMLKKIGMAYSNCTDQIDDKGHTFGADLSAQAKKDLTAFMETL